MKKYSKAYLLKFRNKNYYGNSEPKKVISELVDKACKNKKLSLSEADFVCAFIKHSTPKTPKDKKLNIDNFLVCKDYLFKDLYIKYYNNLNGIKQAKNFLGPISIDQKQIDVKKLDDYHKEWFPKLAKFNHKERLLNLVASEANKELKDISKEYETSNRGYNVLKAKQKSISLHSKYIYLTVKAFFEEIDEDSIVINFNNERIHIDRGSLVHIMFRHYSGVVKQYDTRKSFHMDNSINPFDLPNVLKVILEKISHSGQFPTSQIKFIPIKYNEIFYSIWTEEIKTSKKGKGLISYRNLKTFYHTEDLNELNMLTRDFEEIPVDDRLSYYVKRPTLKKKLFY